MRVPRRLLLAAIVLAAACSPGRQADPSIDLTIEQFTLPNGLHVILQPDSSAPIMATNVWYWVGSARERQGRTGFAHLFEHIMFEGSRNVPEGKIDEWFEAVGGSPNGSTSPDRTNYFQTFSSSALDLALFIESDRMGYLMDAMSPASVDGQRDVVKNERRQSYDNRPYGLASQIIGEALFPPEHPYHWPVIGYMDDLTAASYDDVVQFFRRHYAPNNASLAISGMFDPEEARAKIEEWFGSLPRGPRFDTAATAQVERTSETRLVLEDRVQLPRVYVSWVTPRAYAEGDAALVALSRLLSSGKNSRLYKRLVYELQIADDVSASQSSDRLASRFTISATARAGHTAEELLAVIDEELERIRGETPEPAELERILNQHEVAFLEGLESANARADALNEYLFFVGDPDYFDEDLARFRALEPASLSDAARRWLTPGRVALSVVPLGRTDLALAGSQPVPAANLDVSPSARAALAAGTPAGAAGVAAEVPTQTTGATPAQESTAAADQASATPQPSPATRPSPGAQPGPDRSQPPPAGPVPPLQPPAGQSFELNNGARVIVLEKHDLPLVQVLAVVGAGTVRDDAERVGLASLTAAMLDEGAAGVDALQLAESFEALGARFATSAGPHVATVSLRVPRARLEPALRLAGDVLLRPDFPGAELDRLRAERLTSLIRQHDEPNAIASELFGQTIFGPDHAYGRTAIGTEASLSAISVDDVRAFHADFYKPANTTFVIAGDIDRPSAETLIRSTFGEWSAQAVPEPALLPPGQVRGRTIHLVDKPGAAQSVISIGRVGPARSTPDYYALEVMNTILGGSFTSRLNQNLREDKGYTYGARSSFDFGTGTGSFAASAAVQTNATGPALSEFMNELRAIREPIPAEEIELAKSFLAMRYPARFQSVAGVAGAVADLVEFGLPMDQLADYTRGVLAVTPADVARVAAQYVDPDNIAIVVVGDRTIIEPQIRALGLGGVRLLSVTDVLGPVPGAGSR